MPQILVLTNPHGAEEEVVMFRERIAPPDLESDHFSARLIERVGWAVVDADDLEHTPPPPDPGSARAPSRPVHTLVIASTIAAPPMARLAG